MGDAGSINLFQHLLRRWDLVHPYNAAQMAQVALPVDRHAAQDAWNQSLQALGLGKVRLLSRSRYEFISAALGSQPPQALHDVGSTHAITLDAHISAAMNQPFDDEPPFRPFMGTQDGNSWLGIVYQHWVADSVSIQMLMREWIARLFDPSSVRTFPVTLAADGYWSLFGGMRQRMAIGGVIRQLGRYRRSRKVSGYGIEQPAMRFVHQMLPEGTITSLRASVRAMQVKLQDVFLAALAEACLAHVQTQFRQHRQDLAVGSIIDLRPMSRKDLSNTFGLFLGFVGVTCGQEDFTDFQHLTRAIAQQNEHHKHMGVARTSLTWLAAARLLGRFVSTRKLYHMYRKDMPLIGGLSNINFSDGWLADFARKGIVQDYVRASPTGPLAPVVIATTSIHNRFNIGLSYRRSLIDDDRAGRIMASIKNRLMGLAGAVDNGGIK